MLAKIHSAKSGPKDTRDFVEKDGFEPSNR